METIGTIRVRTLDEVVPAAVELWPALY